MLNVKSSTSVKACNLCCRVPQVQNDPFIKQVQHGANLSSALQADPTNHDIYERIKAQLGSSDGIRGFMVSYLTNIDSSPECLTIPDGHAEVLRDMTRSNPKELVPLACTLPASKL